MQMSYKINSENNKTPTYQFHLKQAGSHITSMLDERKETQDFSA